MSLKCYKVLFCCLSGPVSPFLSNSCLVKQFVGELWSEQLVLICSTKTGLFARGVFVRLHSFPSLHAYGVLKEAFEKVSAPTLFFSSSYHVYKWFYVYQVDICCKIFICLVYALSCHDCSSPALSLSPSYPSNSSVLLPAHSCRTLFLSAISLLPPLPHSLSWT